MKTLIKNVTILTMDDADRVLRDGWLLIDGEKIAALGEAEQQCGESRAAASSCSSAGSSGATAQVENALAAAQPLADSVVASARTNAAIAQPIENLQQATAAADEVIDGRGGILLPGFVNTHCHVSMVPFRSMGDDCPDRLRRFLFPLELEAMTPELVYWGALYGIAEMFLSGTTTFLDMYYFEDRVAEACEQAGIRGYLGETLIGQKTCDSPNEAYGGFAYQKDFFAEYHGARHPRIHPIIAPHGTTTLSPEKLREAHDLAVQYDTIFTLHASEMDYEMEHFRAMGMTPTAFLDSIGALDTHTLAAHCIHMTEEDLQLMKSRGAGIAHCICSNTKAGKGVAPMERARQLDISFGLGTDGPSSGNTLSMFDQMRMLPNAQKTANHDRSLFPARTIVRAATRGGAEVLHGTDRIRKNGNAAGAEAMHDTEYGYLAPGMAADLTLVSTDAAHMFPVYNPFSALAYAANAADVDTVFANGQMVVRHGQLTTLDLAEIRAQLVEKMKPFMAAAEKYSDII